MQTPDTHSGFGIPQFPCEQQIAATRHKFRIPDSGICMGGTHCKHQTPIPDCGFRNLHGRTRLQTPDTNSAFRIPEFACEQQIADPRHKFRIPDSQICMGGAGCRFQTQIPDSGVWNSPGSIRLQTADTNSGFRIPEFACEQQIADPRHKFQIPDDGIHMGGRADCRLQTQILGSGFQNLPVSSRLQTPDTNQNSGFQNLPVSSRLQTPDTNSGFRIPEFSWEEQIADYRHKSAPPRQILESRIRNLCLVSAIWSSHANSGIRNPELVSGVEF